jgi:hypothetical protein
MNVTVASCRSNFLVGGRAVGVLASVYNKSREAVQFPRSGVLTSALMSFALNAYAHRAARLAPFITVFVDPFSFVRKCLFFWFFSQVYEK